MKKTFAKFLKGLVCGGIILSTLCSFVSCGEDSGLGSVIDTKAPTLSIEYPPSGASIRDTFILEGTCSDDISISTVMVTVKNLDTGETVGTFPAVVNPLTRTWSVHLNSYNPAEPRYYNGWQYPDGKYEVSVVAYDFAGNNSGTNSRSFELDNTPPVFIISNPGVVKKSGLSASAYGSVFTIDGTIADNHTISFMDVKIYSENGTLVSSESYEGENIDFYREEEIPTAGGTSVQIAQFGNARYTQLHPSDSGTENYFAQITLIDSTQCYQNPPVGSLRSIEQIAADKLGNATSKLYLYDDVYSTLMSAKKGINSANGGLSAANLKDIISGVRKGDIETRALEVLNEKGIDTSLPTDSDEHGNKLSFSLNPQANPTYNVNGFAFGFSEEEITQTASTGNTISVTVNAGLDGTNIAPNVIKVWMKSYGEKPTDPAAIRTELNTLEKKVEALEKEEQTFMDMATKTEEAQATVVNDWILIYDYSLNNPKGSSVATKTFSVTLPEGIEMGKYYILGVTGYDIEDVVFSQNTVYGFEGNTVGVPPTVNIDSPDNLSVWKDFAAPSFSGSASLSTTALYITELKATVTVTDENNNNSLGEFSDIITCKRDNDVETWTESDKHALTWNTNESKWYLDLAKIPELVQLYNERAGAGVYWLTTLKFSGKSSSGHEAESTRSIHIDTVAPVVSLSSITPTVSGADYFGNGDTNTYVNGLVTIKGNIEEQNLLDSEDAVTCDILASTGDSEPVSILSQLGANFNGKLGKTYSLNIPLNTLEISNLYGGDPKIQVEVVVTATDKAGNKSSYSSKTLNGGKNYIVYQETDRPQISLGNADASITDAANVRGNKNLFGKTNNNRLQINFTDDDNIAEYEICLYNEAGNQLAAAVAQPDNPTADPNPYKFNPAKTTATLNYVLPPVEAKYQVLIKARDYLVTGLNTANPYGEKTVGKFFVAVDSGAPNIEITSPAEKSYENGTVTVNATISKEVVPTASLWKLNESVSVYEKIADFVTTKQDDKDIKKVSDSDYSWIGTAAASVDGTYEIRLEAKDIYDQEASKKRTFYVDINPPTIGNPSTTNETLVKLDSTAFVTVKSVITDSPADINVAKYFLSRTELTKTAEEWRTSFNAASGWTQLNKGDGNYNASVNVKECCNEDGEVYVYIGAIDNAGNCAVNTTPLRLTVDKQAPTLTVRNFGNDTDLEDNGTSTTTNPSATFFVNVNDTNVASLASSDASVAVGATATNITDSSTGKLIGKTYTITPTWTVDDSSGKCEDSKTVTFTGTDAYSREATKTVILKCDNYAPRVTLNPFDNFSSTNSLELKGTITDANITGTAEYLKLYLVPPTGTSFVTREGLITFSKNGNSYDYTANITGLDSTEYNVAIVAKDSLGNTSYWSTDSTKTDSITGSGTVGTLAGGSITIDSLAPAATVKIDVVSGAKVIEKGSTVPRTNYDLDWGVKYYTDKTFTISGVITETYLVEPESLSIPDGTARPTLTFVKESGATRTDPASVPSGFTITKKFNANEDFNGEYDWSFTTGYAEDGTADGIYEYTLTLWDKSKQQFQKTVTVVLDSKKPELTITSPGENESFESAPRVKISYSDDGIGVNNVADVSNGYDIISIFNITDPDNTTKLVAGEDSDYRFSAGSATAEANFNVTESTPEGKFKVVAKVKDYLGHESAENVRMFSYDKEKPKLTETVVNDSGITTNAAEITLSGEVYDTNALYEGGAAGTVKITGEWNGGTKTVNATISKVAATIGDRSYTDKQHATWTYTFYTAKKSGANSSAENYLPDGSYNFAIIATDTAGKTFQISRFVKVDTEAPTLGVPDIATEKSTKTVGDVVQDWYNKNEFRFEGTSSDTGSGIKSVTYQTRSDAGSAWSEAKPFGGSENWYGNISGLVSSNTQVRIVAIDNAGNESAERIIGPWNIDTIEPTLTPGSVKVGGNTVSEETPFYSRGADDVVVNFSVNDVNDANTTDDSGVKTVYVNLYGKATDSTSSITAELVPGSTSGEYSATIPATSISKSGTVYARIVDYAGNAADVNLFAITYDATAPVIQSSTIADSAAGFGTKENGTDESDHRRFYVSNGTGHTFTVSGVATDNLGLAKVELAIPGLTIDPITDADNLANWSFTGLDLSGIAVSGTNATITITDKAGNTATETLNIQIDVSGPAVTDTDFPTNYAASNVVLKGKVSDTNLSSAADAFKVWLVPVPVPGQSATAKEGVISLNSTASGTNWEASFSSLNDEVQYNIAIVAKDALGNRSRYSTDPSSTIAQTENDTTSVTDFGDGFTVDTSAPSVSGIKVGTAENPTEGVPADGFFVNPTSSIHIVGTLSDGTGSGVKTPAYFKLGNITVNESEKTADGTEAAVNADGTFSISIDSNDINESGVVNAVFFDNVGNYEKVTLLNFTYDDKAPKIQNPAITDNSKFTAFENGTEGTSRKVFINNTAITASGSTANTHTFTVSGVATDNLGLAKIQLDLAGAKLGSDENTFEITDADQLANWSFDNLDLRGVASGAVATITLTDKAGNTDTASFYLQIDISAPNGMHETDNNGKDLYFRMGENNNELSELTAASLSWDDDKDKDVGGKYSASTYGNAQTIRFRGLINDAGNGSGVDLIYYLITTEQPDDTNNIVETFRADCENKTSISAGTIGYFSLLTTPETRRVSYTDTDGSRKFKDGSDAIKSNFKTMISGFNAPTQYLVLVAVDKVGNAGVDGTYYTINVDNTPPEAEGTSYFTIDGDAESTVAAGSANDIITNGKATTEFATTAESVDVLSIKGTASDTAAGLYSIKFIVDGHTISSTDTATSDYGYFTKTQATSGSDNNWNWSLTLKKKLFADSTKKNLTVSATVTDKAGSGNSQTYSVGTITLDKEAPTVTLNKPTDADASTTDIEINGIIPLSGNVKDGNTLPENGEGNASNTVTEIRYIKYDEKPTAVPANTDTWVALTGLTITGNYTFDIAAFNTNALTDEKYYYIQAVAVDKAGNPGYSTPVLVKVSQDTDRPVIRLSSMDAAGAIISNESITGTISDDDGVKKFEYSSDDGTTWTEIPVNSGSWLLNGIGGGSHSFKFKITDEKGTVFETNKTFAVDATEQHFAADGMPYVVYGKNALARTTDKNTSAVSFKVDLNAPTDVTISIASTADETAPVEPAVGSTDPSPYTVGIKSFGGSSSKYMWLKVTAKEDVALNDADASKDDITLKIGSNTITLTAAQITRTGSIGTGSTDGFTYIIGPINVSTAIGSQDGTLTVSLTVTDYSKRVSDAATQSIFIDKAAPEVTVTSPNLGTGNASSDAIIGKTVIRGQVNDSSIIKKFYYIIPDSTTKGAIDAALEAATDEAPYTFSSTGWTDINAVENSKGENNDYSNRTSMMWEIPVTSSKFKTKLSDATLTDESLSLIEYATAKNETSPKYALSSTVPSSASSNNGTDGKMCVYVPLYFYSEDETGIGQVTKTKILVDPYAGIPQLEVISPTAFSKTGGNLNFQGSATDDAGDLDKIVMTKLELSAIDGVESDFTSESPRDDAEFQWKTVTADILKESADVVTKALRATDGTIDLENAIGTDGSIIAEGKASWKISVNLSEISDESLKSLFATTTVPEIKIARATFVAYDTNGTASTFKVSTLTDAEKPLEAIIFVDKTAPKMSNIQLVQYATETPAATDVPTISRSYSAGMYISHNTGNGNWYLKATVTDDASVKGIKIYSSSAYLALSGDTSKSQNIIATGIDTKTCTFIIPVPTDSATIGSKTQYYPTIELDDGQHTDVTQNLSFFVDNTAPAMCDTDDTFDNALAHASNLRLKNNSNLVVGTENVVENSDGSYTFGDTIKEAGSGLAYVAFYFKKGNDTDGWRYFSSVPKLGHTTVIDADGLAIGTTITINTEHLPVLSKSGLTRPAVNQITYAIPTDYTDYIRTGSLVKIGGSYHLISSVSESTITLEDEVDVSFTEAEFVFAQVVNHQVMEGITAIAADTPNGVSNDDGDGLAEMVKQSGSSYKWSATILSDLIKDGPCEIHVVAFDEAGNVNSGYVETSVQNNRPRISKVFLGTDLNGNGKFDYYSETSTGAVAAINELTQGYAGNGTEFGELSFYSALSSDGKIQGTVTLKSSGFVAKDGLLVLPEIIGGNTTSTNDLKYLYKVADTEAGATITKVGDTVTNGSSTLTDLWTGLAADTEKIDTTGLSALPLANKAGTAQAVTELLAANTKADKWNYYQTTTTDYKDDSANTHGGVVTGQYKGLVLNNGTLENYESWTSTAGVETKSVKYFAFTIWDATEDTVQGDTSLYALLKIPMVVNVVDDIAPKAVIHPFYWNSKEDGSFCYDDDGNPEGHIDIDNGMGVENPGVSGKVWINATVTDETRLKTATFTDPATPANTRTVAVYEDGNWTALTSATRLTDEDAWPSNWGEVKLLDTPEPNQAGHTLSFRVAIDMTTYGLARNQSVYVGATDKEGTPSIEPATTIAQTIDPKVLSTGELTSRYKMDFVPYIKSIYPATENSASRSRLGKFPVQAGKPMIIEGMNFSASSSYTVKFYKTNASPTDDADVQGEEMTTERISIAANATGAVDGQITVTAPQYSRYVEVVVTSGAVTLPTKNNKNQNLGCDIEDGYVASDDNGKGNRDRGLKRANNAGTNFWTDDRYIAVWNNTALDGSTAPWDGKVVQIDSKDLKDSTYYKNKSGNGIDSVTGAENTWSATWSSPDMIMYTTMGNGGCSKYRTMWNDAEAAFTFPVREMDWAIIGGKNWYVVRDDYVGNSSANVWGPGLFLGREGFDFPKSTWNSTNQPSDSEAYNIIERQGKDQPARTRAPATGYDSLQEQFQNLHITGWYDGTSHSYNNGNGNQTAPGYTYIYVSYYDSFAKCLKYAAYKEDWSNDGTGSSTKWGTENGSKNLTPLARAADNMTAETVVVAGVDRLFSAAATDFTTANGADCGLYNDIMIDPIDHYPVIIYYNKTAGTLEVAHGKNAAPVTANYKAAAGAFTDTTEGGTGWSKTKGITPNEKHDFGRFVSATMDAKGNIHATAQDFTNGSLYYIFLKKSGTTYTPTYIHIDAVSSNSTWTDIRLDSDASANTKWYQFKPVISYIDESKKLPKVAYVDSVDTVNDTATFDAMPDAKAYEAASMKTNVLSSVYESTTTGNKSKVGISFNSDMLALDFLRGEE